MLPVPRANPPRWGRLLFLSLWASGLTGLLTLSLTPIPHRGILAATILLLLAVSIAVGVLSQRSGFFARPLCRVPGAGRHIALTFDDGPDPRFTPEVLDLLARAGQRATFFVVGERVALHPDLARRTLAAGHELANHSATHRWHLALCSVREVTADLQRASRLIQEATGQAPRLFRPPAAVLSPRIAAGARGAGLRLVGHSTRSGDGSALLSRRLVRRRLRRGLHPGAILLLHDGAVDGRAPVSLALLPWLFEEMRARQLLSVPISELLAEDDVRAD